jgi:hypothetical protein
VALRVDEVLGSGGHHAAGRPMEHLPTPHHITQFGPDGTFEGITYEDICQWGGQIQIRATYLDGEYSYTTADTSSTTFNYLVDFYPVFGYNPDTVIYTGGDPVHDIYLLIDQSLTDELSNIIRAFIEQAEPATPFPVVRLNDISLPMGGRFVCRLHNNSWWTSSEHLAHRQGCQADIGYQNFHRLSENWYIMRNIIVFYSERQPIDHYDDHFHAKFWCQEWAPGTN